MVIKDWKIEEITGYKPMTTYFSDFSIADAFGEYAIRDTYKRAMDEWKDDYKYLTEIVMVLNWKLWQHYEEGNEKYQDIYNELYEKARSYALSNLKDDELTYYYQTTD